MQENKLDFRILSLCSNKFHIHSTRSALFNISLKQDNMYDENIL